ncbi:DUF6603 domain-containing protein [Streptomyces lavendulae]|uniref:DUF6603 domain-containing protein n=1 Tax=Streptomyces lavendulae TaxID=1914 RepID=UPI00381F096D
MSAEMPLDDLLEEAGIEDPLPWPILDVIKNIQTHVNSSSEFLVTATFEGPEASDPLFRVDMTVFRKPVTGIADRPVAGFVATFELLRSAEVEIPVLGDLLRLPRIQLCYTSTLINHDQINEINRWLFTYDVGVTQILPVPPETDMGLGGWMGSFSLGLGGGTTPLLVFRQGEATHLVQAAALMPPPRESILPIDFSSVSIRISRFGGGFAPRQLYVSVDLELATGPLVWAVEGLGISVDLDGSWKIGTPFYGLSCSYSSPGGGDVPGVEIVGALRRTFIDDPEVSFALAGLLRLQVGELLAQAAGTYVRRSAGWDSLFLYLEILLSTGLFPAIGPFQPTGASLGFGINSTIRVPHAQNVTSFPFVQRLDSAPTSPGDPAPPALGPLQALNLLAGPGGWVTPAQGQYWGAGGLSFVLFGFVDARVLLLVEGGKEWKVMLAGAVTVRLPKRQVSDSQPIGQILVYLALTYEITKQAFSMDVALGDGSYVLDRRVRLTGGLSLRIRGDGLFVLTLGGFHSQYDPPPELAEPNFYPPPRIGTTVQLSSLVTLKGSLYAAIVPKAAMAGFSFALRFDVGGAFRIEAWLTAHAEILLQWDPFYVDVSAGFRVGIAATVKVLFVRIRVSLEIGVDLHIWGPDFGGTGQVKLWFVSFRLPFGAERKGAPPVNWDDFAPQLPLPLKVDLKEGNELPDRYTPVEDVRVRSGTKEDPYLVSNEGFRFDTYATLSTNAITFNGQPFPVEGGNPRKADIRPMKLADVDSVHHVALRRRSEPDDLYDPRPDDGWIIKEYRLDLPAGTWGQPINRPEDAFDEPEMVENRLGGLSFVVPGPDRGPEVGPVSAESLEVEALPERFVPLRDPNPQGPRPTFTAQSVRLIASTIADAHVSDERTQLHGTLLDLGIPFDPASDQSLDTYVDQVGNQFLSPPLTTTVDPLDLTAIPAR